MNICLVMLYLFPKLVAGFHFTISEDGEILEWRSKDIPRPSLNELKLAEANIIEEERKKTDGEKRRVSLDAAAAKVADPVQRARYYRERAALDLAIQAGESPEVLKAILAGVNTSAAPELAVFKAELLSDEDINKSLDVRAKG